MALGRGAVITNSDDPGDQVAAGIATGALNLVQAVKAYETLYSDSI